MPLPSLRHPFIESTRTLLPLVLALSATQALAVDAAPVTAAPDVAAGPPATAPADVGRRPRVCLVLSGGGARGAAHIGVIKVLEELRVPIDCIAGTSMGAIVGAAYASGMTVDEMSTAIASITGERLFTDAPPRADESMRSKKESYQPLASPEFGLRNGSLLAPKGVVSGVALEGELRGLVKVHTAKSFDDLPIPFRAVATSLGDGSMVVFDRGELTTAMRASMSVPAMIAPLKVGDQLLVDGGLVRNLPVDIARAMGADVIIAVNLGTPLLKPEQIQGLAGVAMQTLSILTEQNVRESLAQLRPVDVLVLPALGDFSAADFDHLPKAVPFGEAAAREQAPALRHLALPPAEYAALRTRQTVGGAAGPAPRIAAIEITGNQRVNAQVIVQSMQTQVGDEYDAQKIDLDMRRIYGSGDFESVRPDLQLRDGQQVLVVNVTEKGWGPAYLRFGLSLDSDLGQDSTFNFYGKFRSTWMNSYGGEWRGNLVLGNDVLVETSFYQPLSASQTFFVEPRIGYANTPLYIYDGNVLLSEYRTQRAAGGIDLGTNFASYGEARIGLYRGAERFNLSTGPRILPENFRNDIGLLSASLRIDRLDSVDFNRSGYLLALTAQTSQTALGASDSYDRFEGEARTALTWGEHTLQVALRAGGTSNTDSLPVYAQFQLGGFLNMSGYRRDQLLGPRYLYGRLLYQARLGRVPLFEGVYGGLAYEAADMPQFIPDNDQGLFQSGTAYLGADTPLGAAYFGVGYGNPRNTAIYLFLGKPF